MPRGDGTGPMGMGPMTGRAAGYCAGYDVPGYMNPTFGRFGFGRGWFGRGGGRGWRHWYYATGFPGWARAQYYNPPFGPAWGNVPPPTSPQEEAEVLKEQAEILKQQLEQIDKRIEELKKSAPKDNI